MVDYKFERRGNSGKLKLTTQFGHKFVIECQKDDSTAYRAGGTAISSVRVIPCKVFSVEHGFVTVIINNEIKIKTPFFEGHPQEGHAVFATEYYHLKSDKANLFVSVDKPSQPELLFINVDCVDGAGDIIKRYKIDTYTGNYIVQ
jgi:hypothetical protein